MLKWEPGHVHEGPNVSVETSGAPLAPYFA